MNIYEFKYVGIYSRVLVYKEVGVYACVYGYAFMTKSLVG